MTNVVEFTATIQEQQLLDELNTQIRELNNRISITKEQIHNSEEVSLNLQIQEATTKVYESMPGSCERLHQK